MVRVCVLACVIAALAHAGAAAGTIAPVQEAAEGNPWPMHQVDTGGNPSRAVLTGYSLPPLPELDDPLKLLSDLKLGGEVMLSMPLDVDSDSPWMAGLTLHGDPATFTKFTKLKKTGFVDPVTVVSVALGGLGLLGASLVLWRRSVRRSRRRSSRRRSRRLQPA